MIDKRSEGNEAGNEWEKEEEEATIIGGTERTEILFDLVAVSGL
jgi:hypothetical protein